MDGWMDGRTDGRMDGVSESERERENWKYGCCNSLVETYAETEPGGHQ